MGRSWWRWSQSSPTAACSSSGSIRTSKTRCRNWPATATKFGIKFPLLKDPGAKVADQFGATRTPEAFVLDRDRVIVPRSDRRPVRRRLGPRSRRRRPNWSTRSRPLLADKPVAVAATQPVGCLIGRRTPSTSSGEVTYAKHIAPILQNRCVSCHREGQIAPFTLTEYDDVVAWADMCLEVIDDGRMPPWRCESRRTASSPTMRDLRRQRKKLFHEWVDDGTPEGDRDDLPPPRQFVEGWQIPEARRRLSDAGGVRSSRQRNRAVQVLHLGPGFTEDKWVYGAEARPGNPEVVHHLILFFIPPGQEKPRPEDPLFNAIAAFAPGMPADRRTGEVCACAIPAGSKLVFQVHYTPNGKATTDRSEAAVVFADPQKVTKEVHVAAALNFKFLIPPGDPNYPVDGGEDVQRRHAISTR